MESRGFQNLQVWQKAHRWVLEIYGLTRGFPREELYGLSSQLRRAAVSVPANIVEGYRKAGRADKVRFFNIAQGSLDERPQLAALDEISRMLNGYSRAVAAGGKSTEK